MLLLLSSLRSCSATTFLLLLLLLSVKFGAASADIVVATDETFERLPEVGGTCAVKEEARRKVAVVEKLNELLPDERVQRHVIWLVTQVDDKRVNTECVARQVESHEHSRYDQQSLGDTKLCLVTASQDAP